MLCDVILGGSGLAALLHLVTAQSDSSQNSSDDTMITVIAVTASIVVVAIIVVIVVGCVCFKKKVKVIHMKAMKRIVNSSKKHMVRVDKLKTMNEHYKEVDNDEIKLFPVITTIPEEKEEEETENEVEEIREPVAIGDIYGDNYANNTNDQDVVNVPNEISSDFIGEVDEKPNAAHADETDKVETEKVDDSPNENEKPTQSNEEKQFVQKKPPSFLNYIIKNNWKKPLVPNIPRSRTFPVNNKVVKRKRRTVNLNKTLPIQRNKPRKKLRKIRTSNYRHDYFMKPMKTRVKSLKWKKRKPVKKPIIKEGTADPNTNKNLVLTIHEEDSLA